MPSQNQIDRFLTVGLIADALGVPVEFKARDTYHVDRMLGHGTYNQPVGTWSDDSSLTLALAENLVADGDDTALMQRFAAYTKGDYTPFGRLFDIGIGTRKAIENFTDRHVPATQAGDRAPQANGNGALMRIAPLAFALADEPWPVRRDRIKTTTTLTHGHARSILASWLYVETLREELAGQPLDAALATAWQRVALEPATTGEHRHFARLLQANFAQTPRAEIRSSGYVIDTLEAAVWCAANGCSIEGVILTAANLGEDTDTVAQIAACLYQAGHLDGDVPAAWRKALVRTEQSNAIIADFARKYGEA
ncbi:ADP-ribosylglycohydrolase family protein [Lacticaseibacillus kribbianus]|uniref:ADP-ribosylglycohydrolase family protein n=1 Tax=Lacticaseibacillus kribbianus TaxID=2926292 RepID=UPI001CD64F64|nr:ADP-ribosylglycohydrolase family protein [Lacticaseibacillus kribbianus]